MAKRKKVYSIVIEVVGKRNSKYIHLVNTEDELKRALVQFKGKRIAGYVVEGYVKHVFI